MMHRRTQHKGSFGAHLDEVVQHFPAKPGETAPERPKRDARELREQRDIHALLFGRAWQLDRADESGESD